MCTPYVSTGEDDDPSARQILTTSVKLCGAQKRIHESQRIGDTITTYTYSDVAIRITTSKLTDGR